MAAKETLFLLLRNQVWFKVGEEGWRRVALTSTSILRAGRTHPPRGHESNGHLGLIVPFEAKKCRIRVGDTEFYWRKGGDRGLRRYQSSRGLERRGTRGHLDLGLVGRAKTRLVIPDPPRAGHLGGVLGVISIFPSPVRGHPSRDCSTMNEAPYSVATISRSTSATASPLTVPTTL